MSPKLAVITVVYQNYEVLEDFFKSFEGQTDQNFQIFVVDLTPKPKEFTSPSFVKIYHSYNGGYAYGVNVGLKKAIERGFSEFCVINNDTYVREDFVASVLRSLERHPASLIGGKIYYAPGFEYHRQRYDKENLGKVIWYAGGGVDWRHAFTFHRGVDEVDKGQYNKKSTTGFITGCLICFDMETIDRVGLWDEDYFLYYEDADYCVRAQQKGVHLFYDPSLVIWHKNSQSTQGPGSELHKKYQEKNRVLFGMRYAPSRTKMHLIKNYFFYLLTRKRQWLKD